jgi:threonine dehydrogenase-like Zn-dependent dehydrogenase
VRRGGTISLIGVYGEWPTRFATHRVPLTEAPQVYAAFQKKEDGVVKVLLKP